MFISASEMVFPNVSVFLENPNKVHCVYVSKEKDECSGRLKYIMSRLAENTSIFMLIQYVF